MILGNRVRDYITGFEGVAISVAEHLFSSPQICILPASLNPDDSTKQAEWFEYQRVQVIEELERPKHVTRKEIDQQLMMGF